MPFCVARPYSHTVDSATLMSSLLCFLHPTHTTTPLSVSPTVLTQRYERMNTLSEAASN
jgi:hypothetical protein